jgi:hypothetical protein
MEGRDRCGQTGGRGQCRLMKHHESLTRMKGDRHVFSTNGMDDDPIVCGYVNIYSMEAKRG